tara:strand:- start:11753 stop:11995 length:243 start_codon:yes stop_codon:yes gene_type:complete
MEEVKKGDRIKCIEMQDDPNPIESGAEGTVRHVDDADQIHVNWDDGRTLALIPGVDQYEIIETEVSEKKIMDFTNFKNKK